MQIKCRYGTDCKQYNTQARWVERHKWPQGVLGTRLDTGQGGPNQRGFHTNQGL